MLDKFKELLKTKQFRIFAIIFFAIIACVILFGCDKLDGALGEYIPASANDSVTIDSMRN